MNNELLGWKLAAELSVVDVAILLAGGNPSDTDMEPNGFGEFVQYEPVKRKSGHPGYDGYFAMLMGAIRRGELGVTRRYPAYDGSSLSGAARQAVVVVERGRIDQAPLDDLILPPGQGFLDEWADKLVIEREPDWERTMIDTAELRQWLKSRGISTGFFFDTDKPVLEDFMDTSRDSFSLELALAVAAWRAVSAQPIRSRSPKSTIERWIDENKKEWCGDGELSVSAKQRIVTLVNWKKEGGAPKTTK